MNKTQAQKRFYNYNKSTNLWDEADKKNFIDSLPVDQKKLMKKIEDKISVNQDGNVIHQSDSGKGIEGSPLAQLLSWYLNRKNSREKPIDANIFETYMNQILPKRYIRK